MTLEELEACFDKHNDNYIRFQEVVTSPRSKRPDLHAFLLLDELCPGNTDLISASEHDVFYLDIDLEELAEKITDEQVLELVACGVMYDTEFDCLSMFS